MTDPLTDSFARQVGDSVRRPAPDRCAVRLLGAIGLLASVCTSVRGQSVTTIADQVTCPECRIEIQRVAEFVPPPTTSFQPRCTVAPLSDGSFAVTGTYTEGQILRYSADGTLRGQFHRFGEGPQELSSRFALMVGSDDSLLVFDRGNQRLNILDASLTWVRAVPLLGAYAGGISPLPSGDILMPGVLAGDPGQAQFPLHVLRTDGTLVRSFGRTDGVVRDDNPYTHARSVAAASDGGYWVGHKNRFTIERWSSEGVLDASYERDAPWFRPWLPGDAPEPPGLNPLIARIGEGDDGVLWVRVTVRDPEYTPAPGPLGDLDEIFDDVLEAIDVSRGVVLARARYDSHSDGGVYGSASYCTVEIRGDTTVLVLNRPVLIRPEDRQ